jgi:hypothetical protein
MGLSEGDFAEYLLGGFTPQERAAFEERVFTEGELEEELRDVADDLIVSYLSGTLSEADRRRFESHFLAAPGHRERLGLMRRLLAAVDRMSAAKPAAALSWRWLLVPAAVLVVAALVLVRNPGPPQLAVARSSPTPAPTPMATPTPSPEARRVETQLVRLPHDRRREVAIALGSQTRSIRIEIPVTQQPPSFAARIDTAEGGKVWEEEDLPPPPPGQPLRLTVPAHLLAGERYALVVEAEALRGIAGPPERLRYLLRVVREREREP